MLLESSWILLKQHLSHIFPFKWTFLALWQIEMCFWQLPNEFLVFYQWNGLCVLTSTTPFGHLWAFMSADQLSFSSDHGRCLDWVPFERQVGHHCRLFLMARLLTQHFADGSLRTIIANQNPIFGRFVLFAVLFCRFLCVCVCVRVIKLFSIYWSISKVLLFDWMLF